MSAVDSEMQDFEAELRLSSNDDAEEEQGEIERELTSGDDDENEDGDNEPAVDLRGYKHCNIYNPYYFGYTTPYDSDIFTLSLSSTSMVSSVTLWTSATVTWPSCRRSCGVEDRLQHLPSRRLPVFQAQRNRSLTMC
jgi:hypothetical protein